MLFLPSVRLSAVVMGDDLVLAQVAVSPWRVRSRQVGVLRGFLSMGIEEARRTLGDTPSSAKVVLTCGSGMCGVRPIQLDSARWSSAREEIVRSIGKLFPLDAGDAMVGIVDRAGSGEERGKGGGYLAAASRAEIAPWIERLERVVGSPVVEVLSPHMAILGLGFQRDTEAAVIEESPGGQDLLHHMRHGRVVELGSPYDSDAAEALELSGARVARITGTGDTAGSEETIGAYELAVGAALASISGNGSYAPLDGRASGTTRWWLGPAVGVAAAVALIWLGGLARDARYDQGGASLDRTNQQISAEYERVRSMREELGGLNKLLVGGVGETVGSWGRVLPIVVEAQGLIPEGGFLYDIRVDGEWVEVRGEAPRASDVLLAFEVSSSFDSAEQLNPPTRVDERALETFHIRASRRDAGGGA